MSTHLYCGHCGADKYQVKNGSSPTGVARYKCGVCKRTYATEQKNRGYSAAIRLEAVRMYVDGTNFRRTARFLGVNPQSVVNWVCRYANAANAYHARAKQTAENFPNANPRPSSLVSQAKDERTDTRSLDVVEGDELFTICKCANEFIGNKKTEFTS